MPPASPYVQTRLVGPTVVARLANVESLYDHAIIQEIGDVLYGLLAEPRPHAIVVDLSPLKFAATEMIAKLVSLNRRAGAAGVELTLCGLGPVLHDSLASLKIISLFRIADDEAAAVDPSGETLLATREEPAVPTPDTQESG
jgi:anti-anti-sigma regulatory factor